MVKLTLKKDAVSIADSKVTQWDYGQELKLVGNIDFTKYEVHFSTYKSNVALIVKATSDTVAIPDVILATMCAEKISVYVYEKQASSGTTIYEGIIYCNLREKPDDYPQEMWESINEWHHIIEEVNGNTAELSDIRVKVDGTTATSAGNAVREQISELKSDLGHFQTEVQMYPNFEMGAFGSTDIRVDVPSSAGIRARSSTLKISCEAFLEWDAKYGIIIFRQSSEGVVTKKSLTNVSNAYYTFDSAFIYRILVKTVNDGGIVNPSDVNLCIYNLNGKLWNTIEDNKENIKTISERISELENTVPTLNICNRLYASETMGLSHEIKPLEKGVICIGFDDYNADQLEAVNYLATEGIPCYLSLIPSNVNDDWSMARICYNNGGEICAHSAGVLTSDTQTFEDMNTRFVEIPKIIGENGFPCYGIIRAGGENQGTEDKYLDEYYCRASGLKYSDYYGVSRQYNLGRKNITRFTLSEMQNILDNVERNKTFEILFCHHINGSEKNSYPNGFTIDDFRAIVSEIKTRDIDVLTINEFVDKYIYGINKTDGFVRG